MNKEKLKEIIKSKEGITLVGVITLLLVITIINIAVKDTHAYYSSVTDPVQIFNGKVGNFKPRIDIFYIKEKNGQPKYTNVSSNTVYITPGNNNSNLEQVCITETDDISTCDNKWQPIQSTNQYSYTFPDVTEGAKVIFGFVKDKYGNKSISSTDTITYDVTPPTITSVQATNIQETSVTLTVTASDNYSGINQYCYSQNSSDIGTCVTSTNGNITINGLKDGQSYTYYIYLTDNVGNSGISNKTSHTFETESAGITSQDLINNRTSNSALQDTAVSGLYRYYGSPSQVTNNYICLGPIGETCQSDEGKNKYMYRILGIADGTEKSTLDIDEGSIKVIKAISIGDYPWNTDGTYGVDWDKSTLQKELNSTLFYNSDLLDQRIKGKIKSVKWYKGNIGYSCSYDRECPPVTDASNTITNNPYPIGLMYASDYRNSWAYWAPEVEQRTVGYQWLGVCDIENYLGRACRSEYTMTLFDNGVYPLKVWYTNSYGDLECYGQQTRVSRMVRPVFYLVPNVSLTGGGTEDNPFTINS